MLKQNIIHLDGDAFFASVEQAADARLRGKPIAVGGESRGIIASASYEARKFGVYTPMPTARAMKLCPKLLVIRGDYERYEEFSTRMFSYSQPTFGIRDHRQLRQHRRGGRSRIIKSTRSYHSSQIYDNRESLASGATCDAYGEPKTSWLGFRAGSSGRKFSPVIFYRHRLLTNPNYYEPCRQGRMEAIFHRE